MRLAVLLILLVFLSRSEGASGCVWAEFRQVPSELLGNGWKGVTLVYAGPGEPEGRAVCVRPVVLFEALIEGVFFLKKYLFFQYCYSYPP